jgi:hypothetical protein
VYKESPAIAINKLNKKLYEHLSPVMLNIEDEDDYEMIDSLSVLFRDEMSKKLGFRKSNGLEGFKAQKKIISLLEKEKKKKPGSFSRIKSGFEKYTELLKKSGQKSELPNGDELTFVNFFHNSFILLLGLPLFAYGLLTNVLPLLITYIFTKKVKDVTFKTSFAFVISLVIFPVFYLIQLIFVILFVQQWWFWILYALSLPASAAFALDYAAYFTKFKERLKWLKFKSRHKKTYQNLRSAKQHLFETLDKLEL